MWKSKQKLQTAFWLMAALCLGGLWLVGDGRAEKPRVVLPDDPQKVVLLWDFRRADLPRSKEEPQVRLLANGSLTVIDPHGPGKTLVMKLSAPEVQELLDFVIHDQGFFTLDSGKVQACIRAAQLQDGLAPSTVEMDATVLRVCADGREHVVRCSDLHSYADRADETKRLAAIQQRLQRLVHWSYAGGQPGIEAALKRANERLRQEFPEAPLLSAGDLQFAVQKVNGSAQAIWERTSVAKDKNPFSFVHARLDWASAEEEPQVIVKANLADTPTPKPGKKKENKDLPPGQPVPVAADKTVKYDYPIVYVRAPRYADNQRNRWPNTHTPLVATPASELMLLHPDGREEVLVAVKAHEAVTDPYVSFDAAWVYYAKYHDQTERDGINRTSRGGSDIYKIHIPTRKIVRLTHQEYTPNTGTADDSAAKRPAVFNLGPCPVPGGKVAFTSDRNGFRSVRAGQPVAQQLFVMDEDGANVENIGHINLGSAHHPTILTDGRLIFSTTETQGMRGGYFGWGIWSIHPDGANWGPVVSAMSGNVFHFQTQLADGRIVVEFYYPGTTTKGFGAFFSLPPQPAEGYPAFGPARITESVGGILPLPFTPYGMQLLTRFSDGSDVPPNRGWGQFTHPAGAPDNHLLAVYGGASGNHQYGVKQPPFDSGIYLIKSGQPIDEPRQLLLVKNDPNYHEMMPRALVSYKRIYGVDEPRRLPFDRNDGKLCPHLPEGTPFGLVGTSSLYKRESAPYGVVPKGSVTSAYAGGKDPFQGMGGIFGGGGGTTNWQTQGADAGPYANDDIHAIRILITEPVNADVKPRMVAHGSGGGGRTLPPNERLRILGEFPVRKLVKGQQPLDPDGNPDTSFLAKIPADVAWTFQTLDKRGMVLNMAQTWHQVRPGEIRNNCGGCHAHSQKPTEFKDTFAARPDFVPFDLTQRTPLLTTQKHDESGKQWDVDNETGLRFVKGVKNVEYFHDVKPILDRSCVACHTHKSEKPAGNLVLDDDELMPTPSGNMKVPGTYYRLALDQGQIGQNHPQQFGHLSPTGHWSYPMQASRYIRKLQSRRSLLIWKVFGQRLDGWSNDDFPSETAPGDKNSLAWKGQPLPPTKENLAKADLDYTGSAMPPPEAVAGNYAGADGRKIKVPPLSEEDRLTLVRWIDLGCPIDLAFDPAHPDQRGAGGWMVDDQRPTLTLTYPRAGANPKVMRFLIGMHDYDTGLDMASFQVVADFDLDGVPAGTNLASKFKVLPEGRWELPLSEPITKLSKGKLTVSVKDRQGNITRIERTFSVAASPAKD